MLFTCCHSGQKYPTEMFTELGFATNFYPVSLCFFRAHWARGRRSCEPGEGWLMVLPGSGTAVTWVCWVSPPDPGCSQSRAE